MRHRRYAACFELRLMHHFCAFSLDTVRLLCRLAINSWNESASVSWEQYDLSYVFNIEHCHEQSFNAETPS